MKAGSSRADYVLYVDRRIVGVIEAKPEGTPRSGVEWQSAMYARRWPSSACAILAHENTSGRLRSTSLPVLQR